ncbi:nucleoside deaminase [Kitasatospora sp. NPDC059747]|uniref:nucleoside deaminase n=1 Tax=Kitasatospora sp. NPDC059747 TaxID=3346930 RepID=UPI00364C0032
MDVARRRILQALAGTALPAAGPPPRAVPGDEDGDGEHERFMWLAVDLARTNPAYPFGAVIVATDTGEVLARGVNAKASSPLLHGETAAIADYVARHGNDGWAAATLYTTGEPCPMCTGAMIWAGLRRIVWASSVDAIRSSGIPQIDLSVREVTARADTFYAPELLLGGVLADCTDALFEQARQVREHAAGAGGVRPSSMPR